MRELKSALDLVELDQIEENVFVGPSTDLNFGHIFGGQAVGQALQAAARTVNGDRVAHSLHSYFLRAGDPNAPVLYQVSRIRDGGSFTTRHVQGIQHGRPIFDLSASFQVQEPGLEHQVGMPEVPPPESLKNYRELSEAMDRVPRRLEAPLLWDRIIDYRPVDPEDKFYTEAMPAERAVWMRVRDQLPDEPNLHRAVLAGASDFELLWTFMHPHIPEAKARNVTIQAASLDHAVWFHRPFSVNEWLLYSMESPNGSNARGLIYGRLFNQSGELVASIAQEALLRPREKKTG